MAAAPDFRVAFISSAPRQMAPCAEHGASGPDFSRRKWIRLRETFGKVTRKFQQQTALNTERKVFIKQTKNKPSYQKKESQNVGEKNQPRRLALRSNTWKIAPATAVRRLALRVNSWKNEPPYIDSVADANNI